MLEFLEQKGSAKPDPEVNKPAPEIKIPSLAEQKAALPENLREEFQRLSDRIQGIVSNKGEKADGADRGEVAEENMSPDEIAAFARYGKLTRMAENSLEKKS